MSGNNPLLVALGILLVFMSGCGLFSPASDPQPEQEDEVAVPEPEFSNTVDTIDWDILSEEQYPPILERSKGFVTEHKAHYNIALLAPFDASDVRSTDDRIPSRSIRMIEFFSGLKYGLDHCLEDISISVNVVDTEEGRFDGSFEDIATVVESDLIIGPYFTDQLSNVAKYAKENEKIVISPWNTTRLDEPNPYLIQLRPSLASHAKKINEYVRKNFATEEVMIITKDNERDLETLDFFRQGDTLDIDQVDTIRTLIVGDIGDSDLTDSLSVDILERGYRCFIVPIWQDESFVIASLAKLNFAKGEEDISVFGFPQWMTMSQIDYDYFENLNVHFSSARPIHYRSEDDMGLKRNFFQKFGDIPGRDAYYGLDVIKWLANLLHSEGTNIVNGLGKEVGNINQKFEFLSILEDELVHHIENGWISIVRFEDYEFEEVH